MSSTVDEPVALVAYDPGWPAQFEAVRIELAGILGDRAARIDHFGSTSVPGLDAKPVLDVLVALPDPADDLAGALEPAGWEALGEAGVPGRQAFRRRTGVSCNIAAFAAGSRAWQDNLDLRDYLRAHPHEAARYARAKRAAAAAAPTLLPYSEAKSATVAALLAAARAWRARAR